MKEKLEEYAKIKVSIKALESMMEPLKAEIIGYMETEKADELNTDHGNFNLSRRRKYEYSEYVRHVEKELKTMKTKEEADGTAKYSETLVLMFKESESGAEEI